LCPTTTTTTIAGPTNGQPAQVSQVPHLIDVLSASSLSVEKSEMERMTVQMNVSFGDMLELSRGFKDVAFEELINQLKGAQSLGLDAKDILKMALHDSKIPSEIVASILQQAEEMGTEDLHRVIERRLANIL
jgi:hypothetical protein